MNNMINKGILVNNILNGQTKEEYVSLLLFGIIGLFVSILIELIRHKNNIKIKGGFSIGYWFQDNFARLVLSIIIIIIGVLYSDDLVGVGIGNKGAFVTGFCADKIIETIVSLKLTNILGNLVKSKK